MLTIQGGFQAKNLVSGVGGYFQIITVAGQCKKTDIPWEKPKPKKIWRLTRLDRDQAPMGCKQCAKNRQTCQQWRFFVRKEQQLKTIGCYFTNWTVLRKSRLLTLLSFLMCKARAAVTSRDWRHWEGSLGDRQSWSRGWFLQRQKLWQVLLRRGWGRPIRCSPLVMGLRRSENSLLPISNKEEVKQVCLRHRS